MCKHSELHIGGRPRTVEPDMPADAAGPVAEMWQLYADIYDWDLYKNPILASMLGDHRFNDLLKDFSEASYNENVAMYEEFNRRVEAIDGSAITTQVERDNYHFLKELIGINLDAAKNLEIYEIPVQHVFGAHLSICQAAQFHPWASADDAETFVKRISKFSHQADEIIMAFRRGIETKRTLPVTSVDALIAIFKSNAVETAEESVVYKGAVAQFTKAGGDVEKLKAAVSDGVIAGFRKLAKFMEEEYRAHARPAPGVWCIPNGDVLYKSAIRYFTSVPATPEELHELGLREVARISALMDGVRNKVAGANTTANLTEFVDWVKENKPEYYPKDGQAIMDSYQAVLDDAYRILPQYFSRMPDAEMEIKAIEPFREASAPPAHYYPAPVDRSRKAIFYANLYKPETRPLYANAAIALHEGVPGHHMQIAIGQELKGLPRMRQQTQGFTIGFAEGWGLYAEYLGEVMGTFYDDPLVYFGRLMTEIWRACRLVVDTGMHHLHWTREQACDYLRTNAGLAECDVQTEIDRYMVMPGQALAYKVGEIEILKLKDQAQRELGDRFSWKGFHDALLNSGGVPLLVMRKNVENWIEAVKANKSA